jgi:hypothetical protein
MSLGNRKQLNFFEVFFNITVNIKGMKKLQLLGTLSLISFNVFAQPNLKYSDEGFNTRKVEEKYAVESPGQQFYNRMNTLYTVTNNKADKRITLTNYNNYLKKFEKLYNQGSGNAIIAHNLNALANILNNVHELGYSNDEYRNTMYHLSVPVYNAVSEGWGDEITRVAIANAYFDIREYIVAKAVDDANMQHALKAVDSMPMKGSETTESCDYQIILDPALSKDKIEVYVSDPALYYKAVKKYPAGYLLTGPVKGWENNVDESASVRNILKTYSMAPEYKGYNIYSSDFTPAKGYKMTQKVGKDSKWFLMVFRNDKLYYSYMIEPCSYLTRSTIK